MMNFFLKLIDGGNIISSLPVALALVFSSSASAQNTAAAVSVSADNANLTAEEIYAAAQADYKAKMAAYEADMAKNQKDVAGAAEKMAKYEAEMSRYEVDKKNYRVGKSAVSETKERDRSASVQFADAESDKPKARKKCSLVADTGTRIRRSRVCSDGVSGGGFAHDPRISAMPTK